MRGGGHSVEPFTSLNLADHVGDDPRSVADNRRRLREQAPDLPSEPCWLSQVHGTRCITLDAYEAGIEADAVVAREAGKVCAILTADCLPVLLCVDDGSTIAAAHCGWRGLAGGVIAQTVKTMARPTETLLAWLGPAIGPQAFEVGEEVRQIFIDRDPASARAFASRGGGKWLCDLYLLARQQLAALGITRIHGGGLCTFHDAARFYSYRRDGKTGRMATLIWRAA
jgi:hypothetical protein